MIAKKQAECFDAPETTFEKFYPNCSVLKPFLLMPLARQNQSIKNL